MPKLSKEDLHSLIDQCAAVNPWYTEALKFEMEVMPVRAAKYSGDVDPFTNFKELYFRTRRMNPTVDMKLLFIGFYVGLKDSRLAVDNVGDFADDGFKDGIRDAGNYIALYQGALLQKEEEDARAAQVGHHQPFDWTWIEQVTLTWNYFRPQVIKRESGLLVVRTEHQAGQIFFSTPDEDNPYWPAAVVDWNGVLDQYGGWHGSVQVYPMHPQAPRFLETLKYRRFNTIILQTATMPIDVAVQWVEQNGLHKYIDIVTNWKLPANVYIDDRAVLATRDLMETAKRAIKHEAHWEETPWDDTGGG
ncbi:MAG TPA: hypothetical protein PKD55_00340 [Bellilinea sp.]|nr:hypothetical protein [Bellilinea sp.]